MIDCYHYRGKHEPIYTTRRSSWLEINLNLRIDNSGLIPMARLGSWSAPASYHNKHIESVLAGQSERTCQQEVVTGHRGTEAWWRQHGLWEPAERMPVSVYTEANASPRNFHHCTHLTMVLLIAFSFSPQGRAIGIRKEYDCAWIYD